MMVAARHREREPPQPETEKPDSQHDIDKSRGVKFRVGEKFSCVQVTFYIQSDQLTSYWEGHASLTNHRGDIKCTWAQEPTIKITLRWHQD